MSFGFNALFYLLYFIEVIWDEIRANVSGAAGNSKNDSSISWRGEEWREERNCPSKRHETCSCVLLRLLLSSILPTAAYNRFWRTQILKMAIKIVLE